CAGGRSESASVSDAALLQHQLRVAGEGFHADLACAAAPGVFEARSRPEPRPVDPHARRAQVAAEAFAVHLRRQRRGQRSADIAADGFRADAAALGEAAGIAWGARDAAGGQAPQRLAAGVDADVAGHGLGRDFAADAPAQRDVPADAFEFELVAVEVQAQVAADALDTRFARRAHGDDVAAHALDVERTAGHALHVDVHRHAVDLQFRQLRHVEDQGGGSAAAAVARIAHLDLQAAAVALDLQALDAVAQAAGDADFG